ncbi:MAG: DUF4214 domain-containing protein [Clostridiales bacterium]|nr:DUF4214 domain-containing protein [Clostridiales bacterium]
MRRYFKIKLLSITLVLSILMGGLTVFADEVPSDCQELIPDGVDISSELTQDNPYRYFVFTPEVSGGYHLFGHTISYYTDPYIAIYDSQMNLIAEDMSSGGTGIVHLYNLLTAGETYYYYMTTISYITAGEPHPNDISISLNYSPWGSVEGADYEYYGGNSSYVKVYVTSQDDYSLVVNTYPTEEGTYTYEWFSYDEFNYITENSNKLTLSELHGGYDCSVYLNGEDIGMVYFSIQADYGLRWDDGSYEDYMIVEPDTPFVLLSDYTVNMDPNDLTSRAAPYACAANSDRAKDWDSILVRNSDPLGVTVSGGVSDFTAFNYGIDSETIGDGIECTENVFVLDDAPDGVIESGVPVHVDVSNELQNAIDSAEPFGNGNYTFQQIYSFTPEADGTAVINVSDISSGVPCVALFDEDYNLINSMGGVSYFVDGNGDWIYEQPGNDITYDPVFMEASLEADTTYYLAVPIYNIYADLFGNPEDSFRADYNLTLTFTPDPVSVNVGDEIEINLAAGEEIVFSFTPEESGYYLFYSDCYDENGDVYEGYSKPDFTLYDDGMNNIWGNIVSSGVYDYLYSGQTYYIGIRGNADSSDHFDFCVVRDIVPQSDGADYKYEGLVHIGDEYYHVSQIYVNDSEYRLIANVPSIEGVTYSFSWSYVDEDDNITQLDETSDSLVSEAVSGYYLCRVTSSDGQAVGLRYDIINIRFIFEFADGLDHVGYMLVDADTTFVIDPEYTITPDPDVTYSSLFNMINASSNDRNRDWNGILNTRYEGSSVTVPGGLNDYSQTVWRVEFGDDVVCFRAEDIFVLGDSDDGTLVSGDPVHIDVNNRDINSCDELFTDRDNDDILSDDFTFQQIFSFTPDSDGTINIDVSDITEGVPCVVVFDQDHNYIDSMGGIEYFLDENGEYLFYYLDEYDYATDELVCFINPDLELSIDPISMSVPVLEGVTYYVAVRILSTDLTCATMAEHDAVNADYYLTLNFVENAEEPTITPTPDPTPEPTTEPTTEPTQAPSNPSADTPTPTPAEVVEDGIGAFVDRMYNIVLGRAADETGRSEWIANLTHGDSTGAEIVRGFYNSSEFQGKDLTDTQFVTSLYQAMFGREPDAAGLDGWLAVLSSGEGRDHVIDGFINSSEFQNLCLIYGIRSGGTGIPTVEVEPNDSIVAFCERFYTEVLGRPSDPNGIRAWSLEIANQRITAGEAARGFFFSDEAIAQDISDMVYLTRLYRTLLGRDPEAEGLEAWAAVLSNGESRENVFSGFVNSDEFKLICRMYGVLR